jgi:hypothetical protein
MRVNGHRPGASAKTAPARHAEKIGIGMVDSKRVDPNRAEASGVDPSGADLSGATQIDADLVIYRLEEAGATLLALPGTGWSTRFRTSSPDIVRTAMDAYGWDASRIRPAIPAADKIDRMDEAMGWIALIPQDRYVLRRVVGARSLVHPISDRHLYPWRRLGAILGADHKAVQRWHRQGIAMIVLALREMS